MGKKSTPKAPATPDYAAAAQQQGQANLDAARTGAELTNTNQVTPYGNQMFTKDPNSDQWTSEITLSPEQQKLYELQTQGQTALGEKAVGMLGDINTSPLDANGLPSRVNSVTPSAYSLYQGATDAPVQSLDFSGLDKVPGASDFASQGEQVRDALYRQATSKLDPQYAQQENALRTRLLNSGVAEGSEAYKNSMDDFARQRQADYGDARDRSIMASGSEQSRLNSDALSSRAQMLGQILTGGTFENAASQQGIDNLLKSLGFNNSAQSQQFSDSVTAGNFQNQQRGAGLDEAAYLADRPLNLYNALSTGSQVTNPQFRGTGQVQGPAAAPVFAGAQAQGQSAMDLYNAQMANRNSAMGGLGKLAGSLGSAAITAGMFSDRRLKSNITEVDVLASGLKVYDYDIFGERQRGVLADEAALFHPEAVSEDPETGYLKVDYSKIEGWT